MIMKKSILFLYLGSSLTALSANDVYQTPNTGTVYSFADLAKIEDSGVTQLDDNTFSLSKDIDILDQDGLVLDNNATLRMGADILVRMYGGNNNFAPADTATIMPTEEGIKPKGIHFLDTSVPQSVKHVRFEGAGLRLGAPAGVTVESCSFIEHNTRIGNYAIGFVASSINNAVRNCYFYRTHLSAIGAGSNLAAGVVIEDNVFEDCSTDNRNYPVINETPAADNGAIIIRRNTIYGGKRTLPGAISVSNMLSMIGNHRIEIEDNYMDNSRYGINILGNYMNVKIKGNKIINCHYETNAMNGGSGITVNSTSDSNPTSVYVEGNTIDGCLWGATIIGKTRANFGNNADASSSDYNPGGNVFANNGNCGKTPAGAENAWDPAIPYDLYNNTALTIYAQGNTWGGADQSAEEIEKRIYHKADNSALGEVVYLPAGGVAGINEIETPDFSISVSGAGRFSVNGVDATTPVVVYDLSGIRLFNGTAGQEITTSHRGAAIVVVGGKSVRILL